ncbi:hypothetical protein FA15DRAFT_567726, partial [Coprinopsis marcescibilis]
PEETDDELRSSYIQHVQFSLEFLNLIKSATLENDNLDADTLQRLRSPEPPLAESELAGYKPSLDLYFSCASAPESTYNAVREVFMEQNPEKEILSIYRVRQLIQRLTGITPAYDDMCIKGCSAYTGPLKDFDHCPKANCNEPRYLPGRTGTARQQACTIPLGPQIQALRQSKEGSLALQYRSRKIAEILESLTVEPIYDDVFCGQDFKDLGITLGIPPPNEDDIFIGLSIDGAQLYRDKASDTYFGIWIVYDYDPSIRYKRRHILPAFIIPGPEKPGNIQSYLFRSLYHLSALQNEGNSAGFKAYDALKDSVINSRIFFAFGTADTIGLVDLDGRAGHHGAHGCRLGCPMQGRHKPGCGIYYAVHLCPNNYTVPECSHADFDFRSLQLPTVEKYRSDLRKVVTAANATAYKAARLATGITKPSLICGLRYALPPPKCFMVDLMHLFFNNIPDLMLSLWRGTIDCAKTDSKATWDWMTFTGPIFKRHGQLVAEAKQYFPSYFHRPPRNPAEKLNSGFKATEYCLYFFGLGPALFKSLLPDKYWQHYCMLVHAVRILVQRRITQTQMLEAYSLVVRFVEDFENLYYQRRVDRIHFCRPCLHTLLHAPKEIYRAGPGAYSTQFTLEGTIGLLVGDIRQHSTPFANVIQIGIRRSQVNALQAMYPQLIREKAKTQKHSLSTGNGYVFLTPRTEKAEKLGNALQAALIKERFGLDKVRRWGRVQLYNGQTVRSRYAEDKVKTLMRRVARMIKFRLNNTIHYGEVQFFFYHASVAYAVVSKFSDPDPLLSQLSLQTVLAMRYCGDEDLLILTVDTIISLISMQKIPLTDGEAEQAQRWFPVEKSGLDD